MFKFLTIVAVASMCWVGGCKSNGHSMKSGDASMSADACPHCPGNQVANSQGMCPVCGMKVR